MLKKKILGILLVLGTCTACITQAYTTTNCSTNTYCVEFEANETVSNSSFNFGDITITPNVGFTTDTYTNILAMKIQTNNSYRMTYSFWWNETNGLMTNAGTTYYGNNNTTHKQNYVCPSNSTDYITNCGLENNNFNNVTNFETVENLITNNFNATKYVLNIYNYGRGAYGPIILCMINENTDTSYCIKNDYATSNTAYSTKINAVQNANYINNLSDLYTYINSNWTPQDTPIEEESSGEEQTVGCMNIKSQIMMYGASYNTGLCYTNDKQRSGSLYTGERVTVTPKSIFEIFTGFDSYKTRRNIYENSCHAPYTQEYCLARMQGNQEATEFFTKIDNAINNQGLTTVTAEKVYQYCHLQLNFTEDEKRETDICEAKEEGTYYATGVTENSIQNPIEGLTNIVLEESNGIIPLPNDGTVFDQILPEGIISWKDFAVSKDNLKEALNIAVKFMSIFVFREQKEGILPEYISSLILIFVFYQIIRRRTGN